MALGGGNFTSFNKILPGTYINFVSANSASGDVSDRGICAAALELDWGKEGEMVKVTAEDFNTKSVNFFGYNYNHDKLRGLRDLFKNASVCYVYRLGEGVKASNTYATATCSGVCGNNIKIKIATNIDDEAYFDVTTYYNGVKKDKQTVKSMSELTDNDFATWKTTAEIKETGTFAMTGGSNATVTGEAYQACLDCVQSVKFNVLTICSEDAATNNLVAAFTKRMREEKGVKFQSVLYKCEADDLGVINVDNTVTTIGVSKASLVWFVAGLCAGCKIGKSLLNVEYTGDFKFDTDYTQSELEEGLNKGKFIFHKVDSEIRVLGDVNSLVTISSETGEMFKENQTVRLVDQIAYDDAYLFRTKYLGVVPNDEAGRISLWNDLVEHRRSLVKMRAIENFKDEDIVVEKGTSKTSVVVTSRISPVNSMAQLYITTTLE